MEYEIMLNSRSTGEAFFFRESILPFIPDHVFDLMEVLFVDEMGLCEGCPMDCYCHVLTPIPDEPHTYRKLCTILFHDAVKPDWKLKDVN